MDTPKIAAEIIAFYRRRPGIGHTKALAEGILAGEARLIVAENDGRRRRYVDPRRVLTLSEIEGGALRSMKFPVAIDNGALVLLLEALLASTEEARDLSSLLAGPPRLARKAKKK